MMYMTYRYGNDLDGAVFEIQIKMILIKKDNYIEDNSHI